MTPACCIVAQVLHVHHQVQEPEGVHDRVEGREQGHSERGGAQPAGHDASHPQHPRRPPHGARGRGHRSGSRPC